MVNQAEYGEVFENLNFPNTFNPTGATQYDNGFGGNGSGGTIMTGPYASAINAQGRTYPIPVVRDDFTWQKNKHSFQFGGTFKWPKPSGYTILNYNSPLLGLGGFLPALDPSLRPADICPVSAPPPNCNPSAISLYDQAFALALAPYSSISSTFNYDAQGNALPRAPAKPAPIATTKPSSILAIPGRQPPSSRSLTDVRWMNYSVPYETHGIESIENFGFDNYFADRVAQSASSQQGNLVVPLIPYSLGGKANHAPGYFKPQYKNFGPRFAAAYSINPKTVINGGAGILYDQTVVNAVQYQQSQYDYLFQAQATQFYGNSSDSPETLLSTDLPRFSGLSNPPPVPTAPTITKPIAPYVSGTGASAVPFGLAEGVFNEAIDPNFKTPYSILLNGGIQHEFPGGFILRANYVGRMGRRLLAQADASQLIDFPDPVSGQLMSTAFANVTQELRTGAPIVSQPWFENVFPQLGPPGQNTAILAGSNLATYMARGDFADFMWLSSAFGLLPPNVAMAAQFAENTFYTNKGSSNYNGLLTTLHKNVGHGLQFDLNYTWSHSIDNVSVVANSPAIGGYGFICDALRPRECRSNSDFDETSYFNGNFIYELPFGRGKSFAGTAPRWVDELIGGWSVSGLPSVHTGVPYFAQPTHLLPDSPTMHRAFWSDQRPM